MNLGEKIRALRRESGMSQDELSARINVSRQAISKWEQGITKPDADNLVMLSKFFQVSVEYLLCDEHVEKEQSDSYKENTISKKDVNRNPAIIGMIIAGVCVELLAVFLTYFVQAMDMKSKGWCYSQALHYLYTPPLVIMVIIGMVLIVAGTCILVKKRRAYPK